MNPPRRPLGTTGIEVSPVGLGTVTLGRTGGLKLARQPTRLPTDDEAIALLGAAHRAGVRLIDTAPAYGSSEERLGSLLPRVAPRGDWVLCTKAGEEFDPAADQGRGASTYDFSAAALTESLKRSLRRLRVDAIDIALLHFSRTTDDAGILGQGEALAALLDLRDRGLVRAVGASVASVAGGHAALAAGAQVLMLTLNPSDTAMLPVAAEAARRGVGVIVKKALAGGTLEPARALSWSLAQPGVSCVVVGTSRPEHLLDAAAAGAKQPS